MASSAGLGDLEFAIMDFVWTAGAPVRAVDVHRHISRKRPIAYTTAMTVMTRLREKGLLSRSEETRPHLWRPTTSRTDHSAQLMLRILNEMGDHPTVLRRFLERIPPRDAAFLGGLLSARRASL